MINMKAILLAAGEGKRLRPYTLDRPKCLVEINGVSLLDMQLDILKSEGIKEQIIIGGYLYNLLSNRGTRRYQNTKYNETNMIWTLFCAEHELIGDIIISYGDIVYSREILSKLLESNADIAVTIDLDWEQYWRARQENPLEDAETLKLSDKFQILEIGQKPKSISEIEGQYMGLMKFSKSGIESLKKVFHEAKEFGKIGDKPVESAYMTDLLQLMIQKNYKIEAVPVRGGWVEIDTVDDLYNEITKTRIMKIK